MVHCLQCFQSLKGTLWWPVMVLGGWLGLYWTFTYHLLLAALVLALEVGIAAGSALWKQDYAAAGRYGLILVFPVFLFVSLWLTHGPDNIAWLAEERKVLVSCAAYRAAHPGIPGYEDAPALLEHVEEWLQKFEHLRNQEEEFQMPFMGRVSKAG